MAWEYISMAAVAILGPYVTKAGESAARKIGEDFYTWLKERFANDDDVQATLTQLEQEPDSKRRRDALAETLAERATAEPEGFGSELETHVRNVAATEGAVGKLVEQIIAGKANVINVMYGDIHM
jgi:hypothetical protein